jgi:hypothetical protein
VVSTAQPASTPASHWQSVSYCPASPSHLVGQVGASVGQEHLRRAQQGQRQEGKPSKLHTHRGRGKGGSTGCWLSLTAGGARRGRPAICHPRCAPSRYAMLWQHLGLSTPLAVPSTPRGAHRVLRCAGPQSGGEVVVHAAVVGGVGGPPEVGLVHRSVQPAGGHIGEGAPVRAARMQCGAVLRGLRGEAPAPRATQPLRACRPAPSRLALPCPVLPCQHSEALRSTWCTLLMQNTLTSSARRRSR